MDLKVKTYDPHGHNQDKKRVITTKQLRFLLFALAGVLLVAAGVTFLVIYNEGHLAAENAKNLLAEYEQSIASPAAQTQEQAGNGPSPGADLPSVTAIPTTPPTMEPIQGYQVIGKLVIEKIGQQLPVISETSAAALKVSCCYYKGPMPGENGNLIITGHDYASGAIFGKLDKLKKGDIVVLSTPAKDYTYQVYGTEVIKPDEKEKLDDNKGGATLTLMTCTSHGNRRLLVRCSLAAEGGA